MKYTKGTTTRVRRVDARAPNIRAMARPSKIGSKRMTTAPTTTVPAVRRIGRSRTLPASTTASAKDRPRARASSTKSISRTELRTMIPARAMKPIIEVAVKKAPKSA